MPLEDATQLSQRLHVGPRELTVSIGGPWLVALRAPDQEIAEPGTLFVGRAGPSVALLVGDQPVPRVRAGVATGEWQGVASLVWRITDVTCELLAPAPHADDEVVEAFLRDLAEGVEAAFEVKSTSLVLCRYCGAIVAPEYSVAPESCMSCGSSVFGIVY